MYMSRSITVMALVCAAVASSGATAEENPATGQGQMRQQGQVRGRDLMSPDELAQHREKMRSMKTEEERRAYQAEQHRKMQERAKEKGLTLPDQPGQGPGMGRGRQGRGGPPRQ